MKDAVNMFAAYHLQLIYLFTNLNESNIYTMFEQYSSSDVLIKCYSRPLGAVSTFINSFNLECLRSSYFLSDIMRLLYIDGSTPSSLFIAL